MTGPLDALLSDKPQKHPSLSLVGVGVLCVTRCVSFSGKIWKPLVDRISARSLSSWAAPASWYQAAPPQSVFSTLSGCVHQLKWDGTGQERVPVPLSILRLHQRQPGSVQKPSRPVSSVTSIHRPPALVANCDRSSYGRSHWIASASFDRLY